MLYPQLCKLCSWWNKVKVRKLSPPPVSQLVPGGALQALPVLLLFFVLIVSFLFGH